MKQKLYDLDASFIEKLKLSENDPFTFHAVYTNNAKEMSADIKIANRSQETILFLSVASLYTYLSCETVNIDLVQDG